METGTITEWKVKEGEAFAAGDIICMVETDKVRWLLRRRIIFLYDVCRIDNIPINSCNNDVVMHTVGHRAVAPCLNRGNVEVTRVVWYGMAQFLVSCSEWTSIALHHFVCAVFFKFAN